MLYRIPGNAGFPHSVPAIAFGLVVPAALACVPTASYADVVISSATTQNMNCTNGVCVPTASDAVLNVTDLENLLATGNVEIGTTGSGVQADNIDIGAAFTWSSTNRLSLDAYDSIAFASGVTAAGQAGVSLVTNDGGTNGTLSFGQTGSLSFQSLSSTLAINGTSYALENSIATLASAIAANPVGDFALAASYDASGDGTYANSPIATVLTGNVQGLGNTISNLTINHPGVKDKGGYLGLFSEDGSSASIVSLRMIGLNVQVSYAPNAPEDVGGLIGWSQGNLFDDHVAGSFNTGRDSGTGGLTGLESGGIILLCSANVNISTSWGAGGLAGGLEGGSNNRLPVAP